MFWAGCILIIFGLVFSAVHLWGSQQQERAKMGQTGRYIMELLEAVAVTLIVISLLVAGSPLIMSLVNG